MAHQTFYIDIDEEITSIVDRLRKAKAEEIIIVVPKRAMLIQSIVNLKLLKKEAERLRKQIAIVTQDKIGKMLIEKTGIIVQQKLDDAEGEEMVPEEASGRAQQIFEEPIIQDESNLATKARLENLGSAEYFEDASKKMEDEREWDEKVGGEYEQKGESKKIRVSSTSKKVINQELVMDAGLDMRKKLRKQQAPNLDMVRRPDIELKQDVESSIAETGKEEWIQGGKSVAFRKERFEKFSGNKKTDRIGDFFQNDKFANNKKNFKKPDYASVSLASNFWKYFMLVCAGGGLIVLLAVGYLFLPKAEIKIFVKAKNKSLEKQVKGDVALKTIDFSNQAIPARIISVEDEFSGKQEVTGNASSANQKARGMITIYNEYSPNTQPLIATTRFQSPDGKIFRLVKGVIIPGKSSIAEETKAGAIEAEVVADEAGEGYNIEPATFTIPGFKDSGTEKYTKFYAKSFKSMAGGGKSGGTVKIISATDIANAKNKVTSEINKTAKQKIRDAAGDGAIVLDDAITFGEISFSTSGSENEIADSFTSTARMKASAVVFNESDLKEILEKDLITTDDSRDQIDRNSLVLQFGKADADASKGTIIIRVNASVKINPVIDLENLKKGILGKSEDDFKAYLRTYSDIERAQIDYWPTFMSGKIPAYASRVSVELDNN